MCVLMYGRVSCHTTSDLYQVVSPFLSILLYINDMDSSTITRQNDAQNTQKAAVIKECADRYFCIIQYRRSFWAHFVDT